ncbi:MAG: ribonuclease P protein component [Bacteroidales bacterium]|nr:ribonuclease P protein component [Bacteroidales bacterium]MCF8387981.1 ribonuclease P protein component [Bacteroidales bacterium]MCF8397389.1 ribonuclease P protein component [Bacteroidales bacterium]
MKQSFNKDEKLKSKKQIEFLFQRGKSSVIYPLKIIWYFTEEPLQARAKVLIGASRRGLKKATDRNKTKRRIREAYRRNKNNMIESLEKTDQYCALGILYLGKEMSSFKEMEKKIIDLMHRLIEDNEKNSG